ncbi:hypothetical protein HDU96_002618 [Phlyctochytrium bullatum]|nr:hypothetical protein HDU96_002618 [Phlyctochytrium bullatum]
MLCSIPNELLRNILLHVGPKDLITVASTNRHLRHAVPACIDQDLARRQIDTSLRRWHSAAERYLKSIPFDHPLLFEHAVVAVSHFAMDVIVAEWIWGKHWQPLGILTDAEEATRLHRVRVLRTAAQRRLWPSRTSDTSFDPAEDEDDMEELGYALEMASRMRSLDLLNDMRAALPNTIKDDMNNIYLWAGFLFDSAENGFCEGLDLIPPGHRILTETNPHQMTLLGVASKAAQAPAVELLLAKGAPVNVPPLNPPTKPALFCALQAEEEVDNLQILRLLLEHGAIVTSSDYIGHTALHEAIYTRPPEVLKLLLEFADNLDMSSQFGGYTPLGVAAQKGRLECIEMLLKAGANVNAIDDCGFTALISACHGKERSLDAARLLIDRGANVNTSSPEYSPLSAAANAGNANLAKMLLEAGANVNWRNEEGETSLHCALKAASTATAVLLLDAGADPTIKCNKGSTPLHLFPTNLTWSAELEELLERLVEKGAKLREKDYLGKTAWQTLYAAGVNNPGLLGWMKRHERIP